jgi:hypothetical protein
MKALARAPLFLFFAACAQSVPEPTAASNAQPLTALYADAATRLRFPVPETGVTVNAEHFDDPTLEEFKFRHELTVTGTNGIAVLIHVWENKSRVPFDAWVQDNVQFMIDQEGVAVSNEEFTPSKAPGLLIQIPRSEQAPSMAAAVFAHGEQVFRVTCIGFNGEGGFEARRLFYSVIDNLELGVTP